LIAFASWAAAAHAGRMFRANIPFDDHPCGRRMAGQVDTMPWMRSAALLTKKKCLKRN
jgi:hypothetical protein